MPDRAADGAAAGRAGGDVRFRRYQTVVGPEWIDYNGHLHDAGYAVLLSDANEVLFAELGLSEDYRVHAGAALYTVECHIRYLAEAGQGDVLTAATLLVSADPKRMRMYTELSRADGVTVATGEHFYLHVTDEAGGVAPMPDGRWAAVEMVLAAHAALERPAHLGRGLGAPLRS